jgi:hypothetical protein
MLAPKISPFHRKSPFLAVRQSDILNSFEYRLRSGDRPLYAFRGGLSGAGASSTDAKIAANIERGF